ncbi:UDP-N-acetylglucosamine 2-epimerase [Rhodospirillales bacterium]|nr:UDP-N-acetylglucosamine 2-epimerase [Rhodospirillales bacterium]
MQQHNICVVTGTRAEYGLLYWLMRDIENDPALTLQLIVTGTHLEPKFDHTVDVIEADEFQIDARIPIELSDDASATIAHSTGLAVSGIAKAFVNLCPDLVILLGDRFEILAAATAATICNLPIAHIHGGEVTEGAIDDAMRHAITKMSSVHFVAAEAYRNRVVQMGEHPDTVFTVGAPGLDHIARTELLGDVGIAKILGIGTDLPYVLITLHPTTRQKAPDEAEIEALLEALDCMQDHIAIFTGVNADVGHDAITKRIQTYVADNPSRARLFNSLGQVRYLSAMKYAAIVVGNSSSGIIEAPAFGVPTVNIGDRQKGRLRAASVIDCAATTEDISRAMTTALSKEFRDAYEDNLCPYGAPGASTKMALIIRNLDFGQLAQKSFYDSPPERIAS